MDVFLAFWLVVLAYINGLLWGAIGIVEAIRVITG